MNRFKAVVFTFNLWYPAATRVNPKGTQLLSAMASQGETLGQTSYRPYVLCILWFGKSYLFVTVQNTY